jgi:hypothetical protein
MKGVEIALPTCVHFHVARSRQRYQWLRPLTHPEEVPGEPPPLRSPGDIAHVAHRRPTGIAAEHDRAAVDAGHRPKPSALNL